MKPTAEQKAAAAALGSRGGKANVKKNGKKHMSAIGQKGAKARWTKLEELKK